jgi:hypothetical protein
MAERLLKMAKLKEAEEQGPVLYPLRCCICGQALPEVPEGSQVLCCGQWWTAKSPETLEQEKQERFSIPKKWRKSDDTSKRRNS